jgi:hypothetical protein
MHPQKIIQIGYFHIFFKRVVVGIRGNEILLSHRVYNLIHTLNGRIHTFYLFNLKECCIFVQLLCFAMLKTTLPLVCICLMTFLAQAQKNRIAVKVQAPLYNSLGLGAEYRLNSWFGLEAQLIHHRHPEGQDFFNGSITANYRLQSSDTLMIKPLEPEIIGRKSEYTNGTPLEPVKGYFARQTFSLRMGYRVNFRDTDQRWRFWLQPGAVLAMHELYDVQQHYEVTQRDVNVYYSDFYYYLMRITNVTEVYQQQQLMQLKRRWIGGFTYDVGLYRHLWKNFFVEGRVYGLLNLQSSTVAPTVLPVRGIQVAGNLHLGYWIR